jgi:RHS repeat-associated protein
MTYVNALFRRHASTVAGLLALTVAALTSPAHAQQAVAAAGAASPASAPQGAAVQQVLKLLQSGHDAKAGLAALGAQAGQRVHLKGASAGNPNQAADVHQLAQARQALVAALRGYGAHATRLSALDARYAAWDAAARVVQLKLASQGDVLKSSADGAPYVARHSQVQARLQQNFDALRAVLAPALEAATPEARRQQAVTQALDMLRRTPAAPSESRILRAQPVPFGGLSLSPTPPATSPALVPSYESKTEVVPAVADHSATAQAPLNDEIIAKATALGNDYVRIYEYVHNDVRNEWYAGAVKGALGVLRSGAGNDVDQASLLTALLRAAGLDTHYVQGVVQLPLARVAADLGLTPSQASSVPQALQKAGVGYSAVAQGGQVTAVQVLHTWVSANVPYTNYRGALVDASGKAWIPLDPFYKTVTVQPSSGLFAKTFKASTLEAQYESQATGTPDFASYVRSQVQTAAGSVPAQSQEAAVQIQPLVLELLPNSLPYPVVAVTSEGTDLPTLMQGQVHVVVHAGPSDTDAVVLDKTLSMADALNQRLTLSYGPASLQDHRVALLYGGMSFVPLYLINLRPELRVGGDAVAEGTDAVAPGASLRLEVNLVGPWGTQQVSQTVMAGAYQAVVVGNDPQRPATTEASDTEHLGAKLLDGLGVYYAGQWNAADHDFAGWLDVGVVRPMPAVTLVSTVMQTTYVDDVPFTLQWSGVSIDAALRPVDAVGQGAADFMSMSALAGSSYESAVFANQFEVQAISADLGLQQASLQGAAILHLQGDASALAASGHSDAVKQAVSDLVQQGFTVTMPAQPLQYAAWTGSVWQATKGSSAGYFISGGLAGGESAVPPDEWPLQFLIDAFQDMDSDGANNDPLSGTKVLKIGASDGQQVQAGQPVPVPLQVQVVDKHNQPVAGALVTFSVTAGDANFTGSGAVTVATDGSGMASVPMTMGQSTAKNAVWITRNPGDEFPTQVGAVFVDVAALSANGLLRPDAPFSAQLLPGPLSDLKRLSAAVTQGIAGTTADLLSLGTQDQYGNPLPNVNVQASIATQASCGANGGGGTLQQGAVFDDLVTKGCNGKSMLGECGSSSVTLTSQSNGTVYIGVILGNAIAGTNTVTASASSITRSFTYKDASACIPDGQVPPYYGDIQIWGGETDGQGRIVGAVEPAQLYSKPFTVELYRSDYPYTIDANNVPHFDSFVQWVPADGSITQVSVGPSGSAIVNGKSYLVQTGTQPSKYTSAVNASVQVQALQRISGIWQIVTQPVQVSSGSFDSVYAVVPKITGVQSLGVPAGGDASKVLLNADGTSMYPLQVSYTVDPADYASTVNPWLVDVLVDGQWAGYATGDSPSHAGNALLPSALQFQPQDHNYQVQLDNQAVKSNPPYDLPLKQKLIASMSSSTSAARFVDPVNKRVCDITGQVGFVLTQDVTATASYQALDRDGNPSGNPVDFFTDQPYPRGSNSFDVQASDLGTGSFLIRLDVKSTSDPTNTDAGLSGASVLYQFANSLPVGQTLVKGVNVHSGILTYQAPRLGLAGRGTPLGFYTSYSSNGAGRISTAGANWSHNLDLGLQINSCGDVMVSAGDSGTVTFFPGSDGHTFVPDKGYHGTLVHNDDNTFDFYSKDGSKYHYRYQNNRVQWRVETITDRNGNTQTYSYDSTAFPDPLLTKVQTSDGRSLTLSYVKRTLLRPGGVSGMPDSLVSAVKGSDGTTVTLDYDQLGNLTTYIVNGRPTTFSYTTDASLPVDKYRLAKVTDAKGANTAYEYLTQQFQFQSSGQTGTISMDTTTVSKLTTPLGGTYSFAYDTTNWAFADVTAAPGGHTHYTFDAHGSALTVADDAGTTTMTWMPDDVLMTSRKDAAGVTTSYGYDSQGNLTSETVAGTTTSYTYELMDSPPYRKSMMTSKTDANGNLTRYSLDGNGNVAQEIDPIGTISHAYNGMGDMVATTDANGGTTRFEYDAVGNVVAVTGPTGARAQTPRDERGRIVASIDGNGNATHFAYDGQNNLVSQTDALGHARTSTYDPVGNKLTQTDELGRTTTWTYNAGDLPLTMTITGAGSTATKSLGYDGAGNKTSETDWNGNTTEYVYDTLNRLTQRTEPLGKITAYGYDAVGNLLTETTLDHVTKHTYDDLNRRITTTDAEGKLWQFGYDHNGNRTSTTDPLGRQTTLVYDAMNRLVEVDQPLGRTTKYAYDANGNKTGETDPDGHVTTHAYDAANRLTGTTHADGTALSFVYDNANNLTQQTDEAGNVWQNEYDALNRKTSTKDPEGYAVTRAYDAGGNLIDEGQPNGNHLLHTYDLFDRLASTTDSVGPVGAWAYDANGNLTSQSDGLGHTTSYTYNALNQKTKADLPGGRSVSYEPDLFGNVASSTDARNHKTSFTYDKLNRLKTTQYADGGLVTITYDDTGNKLSVTDALGHATAYTYDDLNRVTTAKDPLGNSTQTSYDAVGNVLTEADKRGTVTTKTYDAMNRPLSTTKAGVQIEQYTYTPIGKVDASTDANGQVTKHVYDRRGLLVKAQAPEGATTQYQLDAMGDAVQVTDPEGRITTNVYDARRRLTSSTDPAGQKIANEYDLDDHKTAMVRPMGGRSTYVYDERGFLVGVNEPLGRNSVYERDADGNLTKFTDAAGRSTSYGYDERDRRNLVTYSGGASESFTFDAEGNPLTQIDANGVTVTRSFDELNRETHKAYSTSADGLSAIDTSYDANGNPLTVTQVYSNGPSRISTYTYDAFDRQATAQDAFGGQMVFGYDAAGNRKTLTTQDAKVTRYTYDGLNRLTQLSSPAGSVSYQYDRSGLPVLEAWSNGDTTATAYDAAKRPLSITLMRAATALNVTQYTYDADGNRLQEKVNRPGGAQLTSYTYDTADRLTASSESDGSVTTASSWTYDGADNRLTETVTTSAGTVTRNYTYDGRNQLRQIDDSAAGSTTLTYDNQGNLVQKQMGQDVLAYSWNARDHLIQVSRNGSVLGRYSTDAEGLRVSKEALDPLQPQAPPRTIYTQWDDENAVQDRDTTGNVVARYDFANGQPVAMWNATDGNQMLHADALGSIVATTGADGSVKSETLYDAWGNPIVQSGASENKFAYTGQQADRETGLYYFKARYYDPQTGRFISQDPAAGVDERPESYQKYLYAYANPTVNVDRDGRFVGTVTGTALGFAWGFGQMVGGLINDAIDGKFRTVGQYAGVWAQNTVAGAELGASFDVAAFSGGAAIAGSGALGGAGFNALTFDGQGDSAADFAKGQLKGAAYGAVGGVLLSKAAPVVAKVAGAVADTVLPTAVKETASTVINHVAEKSAAAVDAVASRFAKTEAASTIANAAQTVQKVVTREGGGLQTEAALTPAVQKSTVAEASQETATQSSANAGKNTVSIFGFRGQGSADALLENPSMRPELYTGHVGVSFDGGQTIPGFGPVMPGRTPYQAVEELKGAHDVVGHPGFPGHVTDDASLFARAAERTGPARGGDAQVYKLDIEVSAEQFGQLKSRYDELMKAGPMEDVRYLFPHPGSSGTNNCATFPGACGIPGPKLSGGIKQDVETLIKAGAKPWRPQK